MKNNQRGVTLLETILVLSLIAIIMIGGLTLYNNANNSSKANKAIREMTAVISGIKIMHANNPSYSGGLNVDAGSTATKQLIAAGAIPPDMISGNNDAIKNTFGGSVAVRTGWPALPPSMIYLAMAYSSVPQKSCSKIVSADFDFRAIMGGSAGFVNKEDISISIIGQICNQATNNLIFFFDRN